jgi:hypothetical protein
MVFGTSIIITGPMAFTFTMHDGVWFLSLTKLETGVHIYKPDYL